MVCPEFPHVRLEGKCCLIHGCSQMIICFFFKLSHPPQWRHYPYKPGTAQLEICLESPGCFSKARDQEDSLDRKPPDQRSLRNLPHDKGNKSHCSGNCPRGSEINEFSLYHILPCRNGQARLPYCQVQLSIHGAAMETH